MPVNDIRSKCSHSVPSSSPAGTTPAATSSRGPTSRREPFRTRGARDARTSPIERQGPKSEPRAPATVHPAPLKPAAALLARLHPIKQKPSQSPNKITSHAYYLLMRCPQPQPRSRAHDHAELSHRYPHSNHESSKDLKIKQINCIRAHPPSSSMFGVRVPPSSTLNPQPSTLHPPSSSLPPTNTPGGVKKSKKSKSLAILTTRASYPLPHLHPPARFGARCSPFAVRFQPFCIPNSASSIPPVHASPDRCLANTGPPRVIPGLSPSNPCQNASTTVPPRASALTKPCNSRSDWLCL
jgi:hypothetical protein